MKTIVIKTQAEMDALPDSFKTWTEIEIRSEIHSRIIVRRARGAVLMVLYSAHDAGMGAR